MVILEAIVCVAAVSPKHAAPFGLAPRKVRELRKEHHVVTAPECKGTSKAICRRAEDSHFCSRSRSRARRLLLLLL
jgi:hypothetical protein